MRSILANELRLGLFFNVPNPKQSPFRVDAIEYAQPDSAKVGQISDPALHPLTWYLKDLSPIPLTEEWLTAFGFFIEKDLGDVKYYEHPKHSKLQVVFDHEDIALHRITKSGYICFFYDDEQFLYVHQLQNFYFAHGVVLEMANGD